MSGTSESVNSVCALATGPVTRTGNTLAKSIVRAVVNARSGMIALRLMVERGADPDEALKRLRAVRPGAVETDEQRLWAQKRERG